jgi:uncharacterized protein
MKKPQDTSLARTAQLESVSDQAMELDSNLPTLLKYMAVGIFFGIIFLKAEIISWFRIQEMFRMESFHMYGVIGSAILVGMLSILLIKKYGMKSLEGQKIDIPEKKYDNGKIIGGLIFGMGWAMTGACPGPLFAQVGSGYSVIVVSILAAIAGTWVYGYYRHRLPH